MVNSYNTDKSEQYINQYEEVFGKVRNKDIRLLELGILKGGSLEMWSDYFSNGIIVGLDIKEIGSIGNKEKIKIYRGDQADISILEKIKNESAPSGFDFIIDDASHIGKKTFESFVFLFKECLKPGGVYFIEDWGTGYWNSFPDGKNINIHDLHISYHLHQHTKSKLRKPLFNSNTKFKSHEFGLVGVVKQLIDEVGLLDATNPKKTVFEKAIYPLVSKLVFTHGQVIIFKSK